MNKVWLASALVFFLVFSGCRKNTVIPEGYWVGAPGRPAILIVRNEQGELTATVYHILANGLLCPVNYPVVRNAAGAYIQAEGRILISYSPNDTTLFLSPGGRYRRQAPEN